MDKIRYYEEYIELLKTSLKNLYFGGIINDISFYEYNGTIHKLTFSYMEKRSKIIERDNDVLYKNDK